MKFTPTPLDGAFLIDPEFSSDERGFFGRSWCSQEFAELALNPRLVQCSISFNHRRGTLRGMHYQVSPHAEAKLVRCTMGSMFDVIVDLRPTSSTFKRWFSCELSAQNHRMLYIPEGFAHGFQTLEDQTEVFYQMSEFFHAESARGFHWNDQGLSIPWPLKEAIIISTRDQQYGPLEP